MNLLALGESFTEHCGTWFLSLRAESRTVKLASECTAKNPFLSAPYLHTWGLEDIPLVLLSGD